MKWNHLFGFNDLFPDIHCFVVAILADVQELCKCDTEGRGLVGMVKMGRLLD